MTAKFLQLYVQLEMKNNAAIILRVSKIQFVLTHKKQTLYILFLTKRKIK